LISASKAFERYYKRRRQQSMAAKLVDKQKNKKTPEKQLLFI